MKFQVVNCPFPMLSSLKISVLNSSLRLHPTFVLGLLQIHETSKQMPAVKLVCLQLCLAGWYFRPLWKETKDLHLPRNKRVAYFRAMVTGAPWCERSVIYLPRYLHSYLVLHLIYKVSIEKPPGKTELNSGTLVNFSISSDGNLI